MTAKKAEAKPTEYVVLQQASDETWAQAVAVKKHGTLAVGDPVTILASGKESTLLEKWAESEGGRVGTFKLVPMRSWKGGVRLFEQTRMASEAIQ